MEPLKKAVENLNASFEIVCRQYESLKNEQGNLLFIIFITFLKFFRKICFRKMPVNIKVVFCFNS